MTFDTLCPRFCYSLRCLRLRVPKTFVFGTVCIYTVFVYSVDRAHTLALGGFQAMPGGQLKTAEVVGREHYHNGALKLEYRYYNPKKGGQPRRRGPYWYFKYVGDDGKLKTIYIGKCSLEEAKRRTDGKTM
jgi:hypothetical protein